jgi:hypothetical protein
LSHSDPSQKNSQSEASQNQVFDPLRKLWVAKTPEEIVRQKSIAWLFQVQKVPLSAMASEVFLGKFNAQTQERADLIVFDQNLKPAILVECKKPDFFKSEHNTRLSDTLFQVQRYLKILPLKLVLITDASQIFAYENKNDQFEKIDHLSPEFIRKLLKSA